MLSGSLCVGMATHNTLEQKQTTYFVIFCLKSQLLTYYIDFLLIELLWKRNNTLTIVLYCAYGGITVTPAGIQYNRTLPCAILLK